jgi:hypothetical protein
VLTPFPSYQHERCGLVCTPVLTLLLKRRKAAAAPARWRLILACALVLLLPTSRTSAASAPTYGGHLQGRFAVFNQSGFEPDGDVLDRAVVVATLHAAGGVMAPDLTLVLSAYLENFQPRTSPILPDLLHPSQVATSLAGFMQGKAALVSPDGHIAFWGSMLAETFFDNAVHMELAFARAGAPASEAPLRLMGSLQVTDSLAISGALQVSDGLGAAALRALRASATPRVAVSWQQVIQRLAVSVPAMVGTNGNGPTTASSSPADLSSTFAHSPRTALAPPSVPTQPGAALWWQTPHAIGGAVAVGLVLLVVAGLVLARRRPITPLRKLARVGTTP